MIATLFSFFFFGVILYNSSAMSNKAFSVSSFVFAILYPILVYFLVGEVTGKINFSINVILTIILFGYKLFSIHSIKKW